MIDKLIGFLVLSVFTALILWATFTIGGCNLVHQMEP